MRDYWIPKTKTDLIGAIVLMDESKKGKLWRLKKKQLYAVFFKMREERNAKIRRHG